MVAPILKGFVNSANYSGASTDTKPTTGVLAGEIYYETDTSDKYEYDGNSWVRVGTGGATEILSKPSGDFISQVTLTLSATSQSLPSIATGATSAFIQVHGGTVTDYTYISMDGTAAVTNDLHIGNFEDNTAGLRDGVLISGTLANVRLLGTANASTAVIWYFK